MNNILICDDEQDIVSALRIYLESEGMNVTSASNGRAASAAVALVTVAAATTIAVQRSAGTAIIEGVPITI